MKPSSVFLYNKNISILGTSIQAKNLIEDCLIKTMTENLKFGSKISEVSYEPYNDTAGISWAWHPKLRTLINQPINTIAQYAVFSTVMS